MKGRQTPRSYAIEHVAAPTLSGPAGPRNRSGIPCVGQLDRVAESSNERTAQATVRATGHWGVRRGGGGGGGVNCKGLIYPHFVSVSRSCFCEAGL